MRTIDIKYKNDTITTFVDDSEYDYLIQYKWNVVPVFGKLYVRTHFYLRGYKTVYVPMHKIIMAPPFGYVVDHRDRNPLNNQRHNLRICTLRENLFNRRRTDNLTGYKGIYPNGRKWSACVTVAGKRHVLGTFDDPKMAALAYNLGAIVFHGEYAKLNQLD
jgi:predicted RNA methylase